MLMLVASDLILGDEKKNIRMVNVGRLVTFSHCPMWLPQLFAFNQQQFLEEKKQCYVSAPHVSERCVNIESESEDRGSIQADKPNCAAF